MGYTAKVFRILIASPSDVEEERDLISKVIQEWNDLHSYERKIVLLPLKWETHSSPELGSRPQEIINRDIVDFCDMAIGVFWTKIGTPTGDFQSGTIEEIKRVGDAKKIVMLYFSNVKVELDKVDIEQYKKLKEFKKETYPNGLIEKYSNIIEFRDKLTKQLELKLRTLISNDQDNNDSFYSAIPNLEIGFLNIIDNKKLKSEIFIKSKIINFINYNKIPDYKSNKNEQKFEDILGTKNINYYRDYIDYLKEKALFNPIRFYLYNSGQIGIRDIFIEIKIKKEKDIYLKKENIKKPKKVNDFAMFNNDDYDISNNISITEKTDFYFIQIKYDALQPQRRINIEDGFYLGSKNDKLINCNTLIYADCFPKPLNIDLTIKVNAEKVSADALQIINDFKNIEK